MSEKLSAARIFDVEPGDEWAGTEAFVRGLTTPLAIDGDTVNFETLTHTSRLGAVREGLAHIAAQASRPTQPLRHARGDNWEIMQQADQLSAQPSS